LVGARGVLGTTADAVNLLHNIIDMLSSNQLADTLQVPITTSEEEYLLDDVVLIGSHID